MKKETEQFLTDQGLWNYADKISMSRESLVQLLEEYVSRPKPLKKMKILGREQGLMYYPDGVPMEMLSEFMAQKNHSQTLDGLNSRGGLGVNEILANLKNSPIGGKETQKDVDELNELIKKFNSPLPTQLCAVFDGGGHGMKDVGLMGIFDSEEKANNAIGTDWLITKKVTINTLNKNGV